MAKHIVSFLVVFRFCGKGRSYFFRLRFAPFWRTQLFRKGRKCLAEENYAYFTNVSLFHFQRKVLRPRCVGVGLWKGRALF